MAGRVKRGLVVKLREEKQGDPGAVQTEETDRGGKFEEI